LQTFVAMHSIVAIQVGFVATHSNIFFYFLPLCFESCSSPKWNWSLSRDHSKMSFTWLKSCLIVSALSYPNFWFKILLSHVFRSVIFLSFQIFFWERGILKYLIFVSFLGPLFFFFSLLLILFYFLFLVIYLFIYFVFTFSFFS